MDLPSSPGIGEATQASWLPVVSPPGRNPSLLSAPLFLMKAPAAGAAARVISAVNYTAAKLAPRGAPEPHGGRGEGAAWQGLGRAPPRAERGHAVPQRGTDCTQWVCTHVPTWGRVQAVRA